MNPILFLLMGGVASDEANVKQLDAVITLGGATPKGTEEEKVEQAFTIVKSLMAETDKAKTNPSEGTTARIENFDAGVKGTLAALDETKSACELVNEVVKYTVQTQTLTDLWTLDITTCDKFQKNNTDKKCVVCVPADDSSSGNGSSSSGPKLALLAFAVFFY